MGMATKLPKGWKFGDRFDVGRGPNDFLREDEDPHPTKQSDTADCDINNIMKKFEQTGVLPEMRGEGLYGDFSDAPTFQEALAIVETATEQFMNLDARTRARFENDPSKFLEFATDPRNMEEMVTLGLAETRKEATSGASNEDLPPSQPPRSSSALKGSNKGKASAAVEGDDA